MADFELSRLMAREVAARLAEAMAGGALEGLPLWHVGFVLAWRAERLGAETAARDRAWAASRAGWTARLWTTDGYLHRLPVLDAVTIEANREVWREEMGLPPGAAPHLP